jgi:glycosyltransferase involved in cell wall biosynthesis
VVAAYQAADLFLFGSQIECAPLVIYEAMASGTPFVSTPCGNVPELAEFGAVVDSADAMAGATRRFLDHADERTSISRRAREAWRTHYTWERIAGRYEELYRRLAGARQAA